MLTPDLLSMSLTGAAMALAVVVARTVLLKRLPKATFVVLWSLVALRLLVPVAIPMPVNAYSLFAGPAQAVSEKVSALLGQVDTGSTATPESNVQATEDNQANVSGQANPAETAGASDAVARAAGGTAEGLAGRFAQGVSAEQVGSAIQSGAQESAASHANTSTSDVAGNSTDAALPAAGEEASGARSVRAGLEGSDESGFSPVGWVSSLVQAAQSFPWQAVWIGGSVVCAAGLVFSYLRAHRRFAASLPVSDEGMRGLFARACQETGVLQNAELRQSDQVNVPLTYGVLHPVVLIPKACAVGSPENLARMRFVLAHELCHVRRHDVALKFVLAAALVLHWFNPMAWAMWVLANRDIELACDETVVRLLGRTSTGKTRASYARALIDMEETKSGLAPLTLCSAFNKTAIEERIVAIMNIKKATCASLVASSLLIVGVPAAFASTTYWGLPNGGEAYSYSYDPADVASSADGDTEQQGVAAEEVSANQASSSSVANVGSASAPSENDQPSVSVTADADGVAGVAGSALDGILITSATESNDMVTTLVGTASEGAVETTEDDAAAFLDTLKPFGLAWQFETTKDTDGTMQTNLVMTYEGKTVHAVYDHKCGIYIASGEADLMHGKGSDAIDLEVTYADAGATQPEGLTPVEDLHDELDRDADGSLITAYYVFTPQTMGDIANDDASDAVTYTASASASEETDDETADEVPETVASSQSDEERVRHQELESKFAPFEKLGLSYDPKTGDLTYTDLTSKNAKAQHVSKFADVVETDGGIGSAFTYSDGTTDGLALRTVYDKFGTLTGLEEFDGDLSFDLAQKQ